MEDQSTSKQSLLVNLWENPIQTRKRANQLIHDLSIHQENYQIIKGLAAEMEDMPVQSIPSFLDAIYQHAIEQDIDAERVLLCLLCSYELSELMGAERWEETVEEILKQQYLNVWQLIVDIKSLFSRSARMLVELIPCLMRVIRGFSQHLYLDQPPLTMIQLLRLIYDTCHQNGFEVLKEIRIEPQSLAEMLLQGDNLGVIRKVYSRLGGVLQENGFERLEDGTYKLDTLQTLWAPVRMIEDKEDLAPHDEFLHEILTDSAVEDALEHTKHMLLGERISLARKADQKWLQFLIYDRSPEVLKHVLENPRIRDHQVILLTNRRSTTPELLEVIANHNKWASQYVIKMALVRNPNTPPKISHPLLSELTQPDLLEIMRLPELTPELRRRAAKALNKKIRGLTYSARVALASTTGSRAILNILLTDPEGNVVKSALQNPLMKKEDVLRLAGREKTPSIVLWAIAQNDKWIQDVSIYTALKENPYTPDLVHIQMKEKIQKKLSDK